MISQKLWAEFLRTLNDILNKFMIVIEIKKFFSSFSFPSSIVLDERKKVCTSLLRLRVLQKFSSQELHKQIIFYQSWEDWKKKRFLVGRLRLHCWGKFNLLKMRKKKNFESWENFSIHFLRSKVESSFKMERMNSHKNYVLH